MASENLKQELFSNREFYVIFHSFEYVYGNFEIYCASAYSELWDQKRINCQYFISAFGFSISDLFREIVKDEGTLFTCKNFYVGFVSSVSISNCIMLIIYFSIKSIKKKNEICT